MNESRLQISAAYQASEEERKRVEGELTALKAASAGQGHETPIPAAFSTDAARAFYRELSIDEMPPGFFKHPKARL